MATKKGKEKATPKSTARRGTKRVLVAEPSSTAVKPSTKRIKRIIKVDEKEKAFPAKDTARFTNRYCEQMFPILAERNYNNEYLLLLPTRIAEFVEPQIERRQWDFLQRQPRQVNLSWVVEFYSNFHLPTLQSVYVRQKQVPIIEEAIQRALDLPPAPEGLDAFQEASLKRQTYQFDWDAVLRVIALPGSRWIYGYYRSRPKRISASTLTLAARVWAQIMSHYVFSSTHESSFTADMAVLLWCILIDQPLNLPRHIRNAMGHVQIAGNLPFPALVSDLVSAAGVSYRAGDTKAVLPRDDQYVPNGKYIRPPAATTSQPTEPVEDIPSSTPQAPTTNQLLHQILERLDQQERKAKLRERRNKR
ncbi:uncharacterized protein [Arachis hypogaea]|uniref:uncharacterized protein n=1 Tax=Arachis hypogaea TaxID=3818 RepID=UPI003B21FE53